MEQQYLGSRPRQRGWADACPRRAPCDDSERAAELIVAACGFALRRPEQMVGGIVAADLALRTLKPGVWLAGLLDEAAHAATAVLLLGHRHERLPSRLVSGVLLGSALIDVDHLPAVLLRHPLASAEDRPPTHSLPALAAACVAVAVARGRPRVILTGVAAGTACHFLRDFATGGVPFFWPASRRLRKLPYAGYLILLVALALDARVRRPSSAAAQWPPLQRPSHRRSSQAGRRHP